MVADVSIKSAKQRRHSRKADSDPQYQQVAVTEISSYTRLVLEVEELKEDSTGSRASRIVEISARLHGKIERTRYIAHAARYLYKTWVVADNGSAITVDEIRVEVQNSKGRFSKQAANTSSLTVNEEVSGEYDGHGPASLIATAKKGNASATVLVKLD